MDLRSWDRGQVFQYFANIAPTGYSLTTKLDVTHLRGVLNEAGCKFFPAYLWLVTRCLNQQMECKLAMVNGQLGYYDVLTPLYAGFHKDSHTFSLIWTAFSSRFDDFYRDYLQDQAQYGNNRGILAKPCPPPNAYTVSCLPWLSFDHFAVHSYDCKPYFFPSVEAGRWVEQDGRCLLPLSITCHHAAMDGWHVSRFWQSLQQAADSFQTFL